MSIITSSMTEQKWEYIFKYILTHQVSDGSLEVH